MDFQSVNPLNVLLNLVSGNLLPMTADNSSFSIPWRTYSVLMWLLQIALVIGVFCGCLNEHVSQEKILKDGVICFVIVWEIFFIVTRLQADKNRVGQLIRRINDILSVADDTMKNIVMSTLKPTETPLKLYWIGGVVSLIIWNFIPLVVLFKKDVFYYEDYRVPAAFFVQPLSLTTFILGCILVALGSVHMFVKKVGVDVYMMHLVLLITAQYRYTSVKIATILRKGNEDKHKLDNEPLTMDSSKWKERQMKALCQHHNTLIYISALLKDLLSLNFSVIYINSVFRFCFLGIIMSIASSLERMMVIMYTFGALVQLYILCFCVQQLLDASMEVTDEAFHQEWYLLGPSVKSMFMLVIMANNLECKIAKFENYNLSLPSLMSILNQSYSVALLFLRTQ